MIRTPRLRLRLEEYSDLNDLFELDRDPDVSRLAGLHFGMLKNPTRQILKNAIKSRLKNKQKIDGYRWVIISEENQNFIGIINIEKSPLLQSYCVGYKIIKEEWNKGFATEALDAVVDFAFKKTSIAYLQATVHSENIASLSVLKKKGFSQVGILGNKMDFTSAPAKINPTNSIEKFSLIPSKTVDKYFIYQLNKPD